MSDPREGLREVIGRALTYGDNNAGMTERILVALSAHVAANRERAVEAAMNEMWLDGLGTNPYKATATAAFSAALGALGFNQEEKP